MIVHHFFALSLSMCCIHILSLHSLHCYAFIPFKHVVCLLLFGFGLLHVVMSIAWFIIV